MLKSRVTRMDRTVSLIIDSVASPDAYSQAFGRAARRIIEEQDAANDAVAGRDVKYRTFVDGAPSTNLEKARRIIVAEWDLIENVLRETYRLLTEAAPVLKGEYKDSITLFADGAATAVDGAIPEASEYFFAATVPYARKIERGLSRQAPEGVFEATAALVSKRFGNLARVRFGYRTLLTGDVSRLSRRAASQAKRDSRQPAIVILPR